MTEKLMHKILHLSTKGSSTIKQLKQKQRKHKQSCLRQLGSSTLILS